MTNPINHNNLFHQYLTHQLSYDDRLSFESQLKNDHAFRSEFEEYKMHYELFLDKDILDTRDLFNEVRSRYKRKQRVKKLAWISILIISSVLFILWQANNSTNPDPSNTTVQKKTQTPKEVITNYSDTLLPTANQEYHSPEKTEVKSSAATEPTPTITESLDTVVEQNIISTDISSNNVTKDTPTDSSSQNQEVKKNVKTIDLCEDKSLSYTARNICYNEEELGAIIVDDISEIQKLKIDNETELNPKYDYADLSSGNHQLQITFSNGCIKSYTIEIKEEWCLDEHIEMNYSKEEFWKLAPPHSGTVIIQNRAGMILSTFEISDQPYIYRGITLQGDLLKQGLYAYTIKLSNGSIYTGSLRVIE